MFYSLQLRFDSLSHLYFNNPLPTKSIRLAMADSVVDALFKLGLQEGVEEATVEARKESCGSN